MAAFSPWPLKRSVQSAFVCEPQRQCRPGRRRRIRRFALVPMVLVGLAGVAGAAKSVAYYTTAGRPHAPMEAGASDVGTKQGAALRGRTPSVRVADVTDTWLQSLFDPSFWRKRGSETTRPHRQAQPRDSFRHRRANHRTDAVRSESARHQSVRLDDGATYRTMCVRLCDGYFWPVSFTATKREFARDSDVCERSCGSPAVLHFYRNPGQEPQDMVDLNGQPYAKLGTAFRYRVSYDSACKCRPHPWEEASRQQHLSYARSGQVHATATTQQP
jgi:hypothetical protein